MTSHSEAHARDTDPQESHDAARSVRRISATRDRVHSVLAEHGPLTDESLSEEYEMARWLNGWPRVSPSGLRTRRAELVAAGRVVQVPNVFGQTATGRRAAFWHALAGQSDKTTD